MGGYDWRLAETNVWKVERMLLDYPHRRIAIVGSRASSGCAPVPRVSAAYGRKPIDYRGRERWTRCRRSSRHDSAITGIVAVISRICAIDIGSGGVRNCALAFERH